MMSWLTKLLGVVILVGAGAALAGGNEVRIDYERARWHPTHFKPDIDRASDAQCLACHGEILKAKPRDKSPAGVPASQAKAWYQRVATYQGEQQDFHWRHLQSPYAKQVMNLKCNTCHQGNDPREEAAVPTGTGAFTLRKMVNPKTCLMCHGKFPNEVMGLPGPWHTVKEGFQNNCLVCHAAIRTTRHQVNYLHAEAIEKAGAESGDACFGCHGGRQWYRVAYPYPRHTWPGMGEETPDWAKKRMTESEARFLINVIKPQTPTPSAGDKNGK